MCYLFRVDVSFLKIRVKLTTFSVRSTYITKSLRQAVHLSDIDAQSNNSQTMHLVPLHLVELHMVESTFGPITFDRIYLWSNLHSVEYYIWSNTAFAQINLK